MWPVAPQVSSSVSLCTSGNCTDGRAWMRADAWGESEDGGNQGGDEAGPRGRGGWQWACWLAGSCLTAGRGGVPGSMGVLTARGDYKATDRFLASPRMGQSLAFFSVHLQRLELQRFRGLRGGRRWRWVDGGLGFPAFAGMTGRGGWGKMSTRARECRQAAPSFLPHAVIPAKAGVHAACYCGKGVAGEPAGFPLSRA